MLVEQPLALPRSAKYYQELLNCSGALIELCMTGHIALAGNYVGINLSAERGWDSKSMPQGPRTKGAAQGPRSKGKDFTEPHELYWQVTQSCYSKIMLGYYPS